MSLDVASLRRMDIVELAELLTEISAFGETISAELQKRLQEMQGDDLHANKRMQSDTLLLAPLTAMFR